MYDVPPAARRHAGPAIALAGAAVIAVSPIAPTLPEVHLPDVHVPQLSAAQVELAAMANPLQQWAQVIAATVDNLGQLGGQLGADPAPVLSQIIADQLSNVTVLAHAAQQTVGAINGSIAGLPATLQSAGGQLAAGDVTGAVQTVVSSVLPVVLSLVDGFNAGWPVVANTVQNLANVVAAVPQLALPALLAVSAPVISLVNAGAATAQQVVDALSQGDLGGLAGALINAPATLTGAVLNGFGTSPLGLPSAGLLSPLGDFGELTAGTISGLLNLRNIVASALHALPAPPTTLKATQVTAAPAAELPSAVHTTAVTVSVPTVAAPEHTPATESESPSKSESDSATGKTDVATSDKADKADKTDKADKPAETPKDNAAADAGEAETSHEAKPAKPAKPSESANEHSAQSDSAAKSDSSTSKSDTSDKAPKHEKHEKHEKSEK